MAQFKQPLTFMTLNLGSGIADPQRVVSVIRISEADIVALQELAPADALAIEQSLSDIYPYRALYPLGIPGKGLLSRYPLAAPTLVPFHPGRPDLIARVDLPGTSVRVIVAHPPPIRVRPSQRYENRLRVHQINQLIEATLAEQATVLLGDFNVTPWQADYRRLVAAGLVDAFRAAGAHHGATLPCRLQVMARSGTPLSQVRMPPFMRVDYILHTPDLRTVGARRGEQTGSDHLPVIADIQIPERPSLRGQPSSAVRSAMQPADCSTEEAAELAAPALPLAELSS